MNFAIIAAGEGSRLRMEGISIPKPLVKICNIPMINRVINSAVNNGAKSISIIINESSEELLNYLKTVDINIPINIIVKSTPSSMHSLFELSRFINEEPFFLATTDSVFREDEFSKYVNYCKTHNKFDAILAVSEYIDDEKPLSVKLNANSDVINFEDSMGDNRYVTGGLYYFKSSIFSEMDYALQLGTNRLRNFLRLLLAKGYRIHVFPFTKIIDVDHINDIKNAEEFLKSANNNLNY